MRTEQRLPPSGRCCCLQRFLVKLHWPVSPAAPLVPAEFYKSVCSAFPPLQPRVLLGVCTAKPCPRFFSLSLNCFTFRASLVPSGNLWCASAMYLRKEMHPEQFIDGLFFLPTCSCFEETSCPGSKVLVPWWVLVLLVRLFRVPTQEKDPSPSPCLFCGVCLNFIMLLIIGVLKAWAVHKEFSRFSLCLIHHHLNNWKYQFVPLCHPVR